MRTLLASLIVLGGCAHQRVDTSDFVTTFEVVCPEGASFDELSDNAQRHGFMPVAEASHPNLTPLARATLWASAGPPVYSRIFARDVAGRTLHLVVVRHQRVTRCGLYDFAGVTSVGEILAWKKEEPVVRSMEIFTSYEWRLEGQNRLVLKRFESSALPFDWGFSGLSLEYDQVESSP